MTKLKASVATVVALIFSTGVHCSSAQKDDVFQDVAGAYHAYQEYEEDSGPVESTTNIASGIFRGEASPHGSEPETRMPGAKQRTGETKAHTNIVDISGGHALCVEDTESIISVNEDIRLELSAIDTRYLENASIEKVCDEDGTNSNCNFDFRLFPNKLQSVCERDGDDFYETEHSIQCHNSMTKESLYYQFDHYPSCFSTYCKHDDVKQLLAGRIDSMTKAMSEYLDMTCYADDDILRHANDAGSTDASLTDASLTESSGVRKSWVGIQMVPVAALLLILLS